MIIAERALCIELYNLSGWEMNEEKIHGQYNVPDYTIDLLLEKLKLVSYRADKYAVSLRYSRTQLHWECSLRNYGSASSGETAVDAAAKLAIKLLKDRVL